MVCLGEISVKIVFYINMISYGGAERVIVNLSKQFSDKGYEVLLVTSYKNEQEYVVSSSIRREVLLDKTDCGFFKKNFCCTKKLRKLIKTENPDVLISFMAEPNFRSVVACLGTKTKNLVSVRNDPNREYPNALFRFCAKFLYRFADCIVFQTKDAQNWFSARIRKKSYIIQNQVNEQFFQVVSSGFHKDIVTVGRLTEQKNHEMLIRAFSKIADKTEDNLIIYGDGSLRGALTKLVDDLSLSDRVILPGSTSDVPNTIKSAKLFVLSSDYEGMPNALIEAMVLGLPCIATDCPCGGPRDLFDNQKNGILVSVGDENQMAEKMLYMLEHDEERTAIARNAASSAMRFSPETVFSKWESCVKKITDQ